MSSAVQKCLGVTSQQYEYVIHVHAAARMHASQSKAAT
jgi:hypothetical protein